MDGSSKLNFTCTLDPTAIGTPWVLCIIIYADLRFGQYILPPNRADHVVHVCTIRSDAILLLSMICREGSPCRLNAILRYLTYNVIRPPAIHVYSTRTPRYREVLNGRFILLFVGAGGGKPAFQ